jgi:CelD/BcsL family acetyltransferase involved in cellulose biosynthesis
MICGTQKMLELHCAWTQVCESLEELQPLVPQWEDLLASIPGASIFNTWDYLAPWWRAFGGRQRLLVLAFHDATSKLMGLAPLAFSVKRIAGMRVRVVRLMGDGNYSDHLDILARPGAEEGVAAALVEFLAKRTSLWDICELNTLPSLSPCGGQVLRQLGTEGWPHLTYSRPAAMVLLPESWEVYLKLISAMEREKIGRFSRRLERKYKARFYKCRIQDEVNTCLEHLFRLHQKRWELRGEPGSFRPVECRNFFKELSRSLLDRGQLEFWLLELDGQAVAALFGLRYRDAVYALQGGFDPDYSANSVGYVLTAYILKQLRAAGIRRYDFLAGSSPAKTRWGAQTGSYLDIHFSRSYSLGSLCLHTRESGRNAKEWLRESLPSPAWNVLRRIHVGLRSFERGRAADSRSGNLAVMRSASPCQPQRARL